MGYVAHRRDRHGQKRDAELFTYRIDDCPNQQRAEQPCAIAPQRVDPVPPDRDYNVLAFEKRLYLFRSYPLSQHSRTAATLLLL